MNHLRHEKVVPHSGKRFMNLEDYGLIGNQETCALVGRNGSIDWLAVPYLDSPSMLAAILDPERGGRFSITPIFKYQSSQRYLENSNVLVTDFATATGETSITDFMPPLEGRGPHRMLLRKIEATRHDTTVQVTFHPGFEYGRHKAEVKREGKLLILSGENFSVAISGAGLAPGENEAGTLLSLHEGETAWIVLSWEEHPKLLSEQECERLLKKSLEFWNSWSSRHARSESVDGELLGNLAVRSGLALKLLINPDTGGIAAAASLSLPESIGGIRNWDYRFAWIRDASFTAQALFHLGYSKEATAYRNWVLKILKQIDNLSDIRPLYSLHESAQTEEGVAEGLCGYRNSAPVRLGNLAVRQTQMDIYGELVNTVYETTRYGHDLHPQVWETVKQICEFTRRNWERKDRGIWEFRTPPKNYVHSKLMCWLALDRGIAMARNNNLDAPVGAWGEAAEKIRNAILEKGFSKRLNSFVQSFEEETLDATSLLIPIHNFLPPEDPRVQSTIDAVWDGLSAGNGLIYRYTAEDGLPGKEGAFILCSFWLVNALAVSRRTQEAETLFKLMLQYVSPLGLLSEEVDPRQGQLIGNFPQALSHIGLINAALHLGIAKGRGCEGPRPQSEKEAR